MVKIEQVNKYFNRRKRNQIHVINNTSLQLEESGMVALLGPSGCGKTTLLNVIGGLDNVSNGAVYINGEKITGRRAGKIDQIRNLNIGYIFQNYNLIENKTVFENVAMVLRMVGIKDPAEINEKVRYALELVGMYRYRNRFADMLSGGERQRVGIARAIVKNPAIIIADEPTGNLDSRNTLEVMNIIKTISKKKLVILVTHEEPLANFYATRIVRLKDGEVVSDEANENSDNLDYRLENKIYLKDIKKAEDLKGEGYDIRLFNDGGQPMTLDIVIKKGNIYIQGKEGERLEIVDDNSSIELIDDHYRQMTKEESEAYTIDETKLEGKNSKKHSSIFNPITLITSGFKTVSGYHIFKKILLAGFFVSAMFVMYSLSVMGGALNMPDSKFVTNNKDYLSVATKKVDINKYYEYAALPSVDYLLPGDGHARFNFRLDDYIQTYNSTVQIPGSLTAADRITEADLIAGKMPAGPQEIVIDKMSMKTLMDEGSLKQAGIFSATDMVGRVVTVPNMPDFTIVGVTDRQEPTIYAHRDQLMNIMANSPEASSGGGDAVYGGSGTHGEGGSPQVVNVDLKAGDITLKKGKMPVNDYEVIVNIKHEEAMPLNKEINEKVYEKKLKVVGYYVDKYDGDLRLVNANTADYNTIASKSNFTVAPKDKAAALEALRTAGLNVSDIYEKSKEAYQTQRMESLRASLVMGAVVLAISLVEIYLIMRASFLSRVKEVGVLRAIGVKKSDIYKMFMGEIIAITTMGSLPGYLFMCLVVSKLAQVKFFTDILLFNSTIMIGGIIILFGLNLLFGLLPVFKTLLKTPAAILARNDVN